MLAPWTKSNDKPRQHIKKQRHTVLIKVHLVKAMVFPVVNVWMWELDHKEGWVLKNWHCWTMALEKMLENPLESKEIKPVNPKGNQSWIFTGRIDAEAEALILWSPDVKSWLIRKDPDAGRDWRQEENGLTEDEIVGWHYQLNGHEFEQALGDGEGRGGLLDMTEWLNK